MEWLCCDQSLDFTKRGLAGTSVYSCCYDGLSDETQKLTAVVSMALLSPHAASLFTISRSFRPPFVRFPFSFLPSSEGEGSHSRRTLVFLETHQHTIVWTLQYTDENVGNRPSTAFSPSRAARRFTTDSPLVAFIEPDRFESAVSINVSFHIIILDATSARADLYVSPDRQFAKCSWTLAYSAPFIPEYFTRTPHD